MRVNRFNGALLSTLVIASIVGLAIQLLSPSPVHAALTSHAPIYIDGNSNFTLANGVTSGSGTENNPYIIENWDIDASSANGIKIENTTAHFVIRSCYVHGGEEGIAFSYYGIIFDNVTNGIAENNICSDDVSGIDLDSSNNNLVSGNILEKNGDSIILWSSDNNLISGNTCENNYFGISFLEADMNLVIGNMMDNNSIGINLFSSDNNSISGNGVRNNYISGISLASGSDNNLISNNIIENNMVSGLYLSSSQNNLIPGNSVENSFSGIELHSSDNQFILGNTFIGDGLWVDNSYHNIVENNKVNRRPLVYLEGVSNRVVGDAGQVILVRCEKITIDNMNLSNASIGLELWETNSSKAINNVAGNDLYGIYLGYSENNLISNNTAENSSGGIYLYFSNNNLIFNNIEENNKSLYLSSSNGYVSSSGIYLSSSENNLISGNSVENNRIGIELYSSDNNFINHNNFISNAAQAYDDSLNFWDNGYPSGGNYWSDYTGVDNYQGKNQTIPGSDNIGDTSYYIPAYNAMGNNLDHYPLMIPFVPIMAEEAQMRWLLIIGIIIVATVIGITTVLYTRRHFKKVRKRMRRKGRRHPRK